MGSSILPKTNKSQPNEIINYLDPDGLRQLLRQLKLHLQLKPDTDIDYYDDKTNHKFTSVLHNKGSYQRMELKTYPDNDGYEGYAGIHIDSGTFGLEHSLEGWTGTQSDASKNEQVNRVQIGAMAVIPSKEGCYITKGDVDTKSHHRIAAMLFDPYDGRAYLYSNDDARYVNNLNRSKDTKLPPRTVARVVDIPTHLTDLENDLDFVADIDYHHTDNNFTNSNRYLVDNLDDRTFVYPEIAKDVHGEYIENYRVGLSGEQVYAEGDGEFSINQQYGFQDRIDAVISSYGYNRTYSGVNHKPGYLPAIFRSIEELKKVDLVGQLRTPMTNRETPGAKRPYNYYLFDGVWSPSWYDREGYKDSYMAQSLNPLSLENILDQREPKPFATLNQDPTNKYTTAKLYQWRYNRVSIVYHSKDISINVVDTGKGYRVGDILRFTFCDDVIKFKVNRVNSYGGIISGEHIKDVPRIYEQDPSTNRVGVSFTNASSVGSGATLAISCKATIKTNATQIKNNLYAYVDITPSVRSDNTSEWSDTSSPTDSGGRVVVRSTAAHPAYSGINSGRGGPAGNPNGTNLKLYEHGGNATAGIHVHLFRYVINTQNPSWVIKDGVQVFLGDWVDQGPMGLERPCDIKALLFSNPDTNNFNNYYKFNLDTYFDTISRNPDSVVTGNSNAISQMYLHVAQKDPDPDQKFFDTKVNASSAQIEQIDITNKVLYLNAATRVAFIYNAGPKNDSSFGYGYQNAGWIPLSGTVSR